MRFVKHPITPQASVNGDPAESIDKECEATKKRFNNFLIFSSHLYNNIAVLLHGI